MSPMGKVQALLLLAKAIPLLVLSFRRTFVQLWWFRLLGWTRRVVYPWFPSRLQRLGWARWWFRFGSLILRQQSRLTGLVLLSSGLTVWEIVL